MSVNIWVPTDVEWYRGRIVAAQEILKLHVIFLLIVYVQCLIKTKLPVSKDICIEFLVAF